MIRLEYNPKQGQFQYNYDIDGVELKFSEWKSLCNKMSLNNCEDFMKYIGEIPYEPGQYDTLEEMKLKLEDFLLNT